MNDSVWIYFSFLEAIRNRVLKNQKSSHDIIDKIKLGFQDIHGNDDMIEDVIIPAELGENENNKYMLGIILLKMPKIYYGDLLRICADYPLRKMIRQNTISVTTDEIVNNILNASKEEDNKLKFKVGDKVIIIDGIEKDMPGFITAIEDETIFVTYEILGREITSKFKINNLEKYSNIHANG